MKTVKYCVVCGKSHTTRSPKYCSTECANKDYYARHQKELKEAHIEWYYNNKDKADEIRKRWKENNKERYIEYQAEYRRKRREAKNATKETV